MKRSRSRGSPRSGASRTRRPAMRCGCSLRDPARPTRDLGIDPGLQKDGVEADLQRLLAEQVERISDGATLVRREYPTAIGPVDLLVRMRRRGHRGRDQAPWRHRRRRTAHPLPRAAGSRPASRPGAGRVRRAGDQAAGTCARRGSRHPLPRARLRRHARPRRHPLAPVLTMFIAPGPNTAAPLG